MASEAINFAGDKGQLGEQPRSDTLPLLDMLFGEQAQASAQAEKADTGAAIDDTPGPGTPVVPEASATAAAPPSPSPTLPAFDSSLPASANVAPAPSAPIASAATAHEDITPRSLSPNAIVKASDALENQGVVDKEKAATLAEKGATDLAEAQNVQAQESQPFKEKAAQIYEQKAKAQDIIANLATEVHQRFLANTQEDLEAQKKLALENPNDFWGNRSTPQRINAVIGMIAASVAGMNTVAYVDNMINQDVAAYNRKRDALARIRGLHIESNKESEANIRDASQMIETQSIARLAWVESAMQAKINQSSNMVVRANLEKTLAEIRTKKADDIAALNNQKMNRWATEEQHALAWAQLDMERQKAQQAGVPNDDSVPFDVAEQTIPGGKRGVPKNLSVGVKKDVDSKVDLLNNLDQIEAMWHKFEAGGMSLPEAVQSSAPFRSAIQAGARKSTGVGANLQGSEQEQMNGVSILLRDIALGKVTGSDWLKKLHAIQDMTTSSVKQSVTSNTPGLRIRKDSAPGRVLARQEQDAQREEVEMEQVRTALQGKTPIAQQATLVMLAKNGSRVAQNLLKKKKAESFIGRTKQLFGIGQDDDE